MMTPDYSPYEPIPEDSEWAKLLITIKEASATYRCSGATLKNNAKTRHLRAFQQFFGAPVLVLLSDVEAFLKLRPDITSVFQPKSPQVAQFAYGIGGTEATAPWATGSPQAQPPHPPQVLEAASQPPVAKPAFAGEAGFLRLKSLSAATPGERSLVARVILEIFALINQPAPPSPPSQQP